MILRWTLLNYPSTCHSLVEIGRSLFSSRCFSWDVAPYTMYKSNVQYGVWGFANSSTCGCEACLEVGCAPFELPLIEKRAKSHIDQSSKNSYPVDPLTNTEMLRKELQRLQQTFIEHKNNLKQLNGNPQNNGIKHSYLWVHDALHTLKIVKSLKGSGTMLGCLQPAQT